MAGHLGRDPEELPVGAEGHLSRPRSHQDGRDHLVVRDGDDMHHVGRLACHQHLLPVGADADSFRLQAHLDLRQDLAGIRVQGGGDAVVLVR